MMFKKIGDAIQTVVDIWNTLQAISGGHLIRDILLIAAAWKAVTIAIAVAKAAQIAFNLISGGGAGGAAGNAMNLAKGIIGTGGMGAAIGAAEVVPALGGLAILAAVYYGAYKYSKNPTPENLNPNTALLSAQARSNMMSSPAASYIASMMIPVLAASLNSQAIAPNTGVGQPIINLGVNVDNRQAPGVTSIVRPSPPITGPFGYQWGGAQ